MVANTGIAGNIPVAEMTSDKWDHVMDVNAKGTFLCYKYAGMKMIEQGNGGRTIGVSSIYGKQGGAVNFACTASKFAIRGLTQAAALEFGPHGITVNVYAPGAIDTDMLADIATEDYPHQAIIEGFKKQPPLGLIGVPADIANMVSFIASKESRYITGQSAGENRDHMASIACTNDLYSGGTPALFVQMALLDPRRLISLKVEGCPTS
ncbi:hypothetical protein B0H17DRAFT_1210785 [Mycena rosella]|uniref:NAD(P)-binding protein n=1 Tax=Mycena rosella TaxID=1033263 RepID=A0AAD7CWQ0_MYCRO|nr:hypothetical protein B0H17DRAFT_1210785 [Mycena rosella]